MRLRQSLLLMISSMVVTLLLVACGGEQTVPASSLRTVVATSVPPTATSAPPAATPVPPIETPRPTATPEPSATTTATPFEDYAPYRPLMDEVVFLGPLYTTSATEVPVAALEHAGTMLSIMLRHRPDVVETLQAAGALTAVFGRSQSVCDLPYFSDLKGTRTCQEPGGLGGVPGRPATACSEKNVLKQPDDPFGRGTRTDGENVCAHELAHTIMNVGLTDEERLAIRKRFEAALQEGLWKGDFALENADEFFAEMSQTYFCANPEVSAFLHTHGINCAEELQAYDPSTFSLIDGIYREFADLR